MAIDDNDAETKLVELESAVRYIFSKCDSRNRQYITKVDIMNAMHFEEVIELVGNYEPLQRLLHPKFFKETFDSIDSNKDGKIDYFELLNFCGIPTSPQTVNSTNGENGSNERSETTGTNIKNGKVDEITDEEKYIVRNS